MNGPVSNALALSAIASTALAMDPQAIMRKAQALQATCQQAGLPIDFASAVSSVMDEAADGMSATADPALIAQHAQTLQSTFRRLGLEIDLAGALSAVHEALSD